MCIRSVWVCWKVQLQFCSFIQFLFKPLNFPRKWQTFDSREVRSSRGVGSIPWSWTQFKIYELFSSSNFCCRRLLNCVFGIVFFFMKILGDIMLLTSVSSNWSHNFIPLKKQYLYRLFNVKGNEQINEICKIRWKLFVTFFWIIYQSWSQCIVKCLSFTTFLKSV